MQTRPLALAASLLALCGCLMAGAAQSATVEQVVAHYADIVHAGYADAHTRAVELQRALQTLTERPSAAALEAAKNAWKRARIPYGQTEAFRFYGGPIDDADGPEGLINAWPMDEGYVDYVVGNASAGIINNPDTPITKRTSWRSTSRAARKTSAPATTPSSSSCGART